jgi:hypothetical protein
VLVDGIDIAFSTVGKIAIDPPPKVGALVLSYVRPGQRPVILGLVK